MSDSSDKKVYITSLLGNSQFLDGGAMFGNAPRALWTRWCDSDEKGRIKLSCRSMLVELGDRKILCEVGIGAYMSPEMKERYGVAEDTHVLLESLKFANLDCSEITDVVLSHLHFDHAGGLLGSYDSGQKDQLLFDNARYYISKESFDRARSPHLRDRASFIPGLVDKLLDSERLSLIDRETTCESGLPKEFSFVFSDGHTPGMMLPVVSGKSATMIFMGDLVPGEPWVHLPITMGYDRFPEGLVNEKKDLYSRFKHLDWIAFFTHDVNIAGGVLGQSSDNRYRVVERFDSFERFEL